MSGYFINFSKSVFYGVFGRVFVICFVVWESGYKISIFDDSIIVIIFFLDLIMENVLIECINIYYNFFINRNNFFCFFLVIMLFWY